VDITIIDDKAEKSHYQKEIDAVEALGYIVKDVKVNKKNRSLDMTVELPAVTVVTVKGKFEL
jgi:hypothetical protein